MRRWTPIALVLAVSVGGCRCREPSGRPDEGAHRDEASVAPEAEGAEVALLQELAILARGRLADTAAAKDAAARIARGESSQEAWIDAQLDTDEVGATVAFEMLLGLSPTAQGGRFVLPFSMVLRTTPPDGEGRVAYFLRDPACTAAEAERVHPWWEPTTTVLVCPEAHQPEHRFDAEHGWYCGGLNLSPHNSTYCGCGANLVNCTASASHRGSVAVSMREEVRRTLARIVGEDLPISTFFTTNETVHDERMAAYYQGWRVATGELDDWQPLPARDVRSPSARFESRPGMHAGVLTMPYVFYLNDGLRDTLRYFYDVMWCQGMESLDVTAEAVLSLGKTSLREGEGWRELAHKPVCTRCHARLDYGMQFFGGFPSTNVALAFVAKLQKDGQGLLYGADIEDPRGTGTLTPRGFAELATGQPEFAACMTRRVANHVWNGRATAADVAALREAFAAKPTFRTIMRIALRRFAADWKAVGAPAANRPLEAAEAAEGGDVRLSGALIESLDDRCGDCHTGEGEVAFAGKTAVSHGLGLHMLREIAFGGMPQGIDGLDPDDRAALTSALLDGVYPDPPARTLAAHYFAGAMDALPVRSASTVREIIRARARASATVDAGGAATAAAELQRAAAVPPAAAAGTLAASEEGLPAIDERKPAESAQFTTSGAVIMGLEALQACKRAGATGDALDRCLARATSLRGVLNLGPPPPVPESVPR